MRIVQVMDSLDFGDAVSNSAVCLWRELRQRGFDSMILSRHFHPSVAQYRRDVEGFTPVRSDIVIFHFSGRSELLPTIVNWGGKRVVIFHNVTPPTFFEELPAHQAHCSEGLVQAQAYLGAFDVALGVSPFNVAALRSYGARDPQVLPLAMDLPKRLGPDCNPCRTTSRWLYVGRVAPNKCVEDVILTFSEYWERVDRNSQLRIVGNVLDYGPYYRRLQKLLDLLPVRQHVVFSGKVSDAALRRCYRNSDVLILMSEHEGFCAPLIEAMWCGLLTVAFDAGAVRETMGGQGVLVLQKQHAAIAELIGVLGHEQPCLTQIVDGERNRAEAFDIGSVVDRLTTLVGLAKTNC